MGDILHFVGPRKFIQIWLDNSIKCDDVSFCYFLLRSCSPIYNLFHEESKTSYISPTRSGHALGIWMYRCTYLVTFFSGVGSENLALWVGWGGGGNHKLFGTGFTANSTIYLPPCSNYIAYIICSQVALISMSTGLLIHTQKKITFVFSPNKI